MRLGDLDAFKMEDFRHCLDCDSIMQVIKYAPTIDAVPVVRCKDCKYLHEADFKYVQHCVLNEHQVDADDFCSYGERKDGEG